ncbi:HAMP domain-containing sensor histidine kinase [Treponema sp.]|uniref:HAMP domain-containing sensor histidine kinase n=1 Tax=Treponema sp. TaxID=166 RepID=UPI0025D3DB42|nr:HAMP domain-containing sensor histidine kinase [Treponema sp.]MCR5218749.1 HAMP domain-containing histidine kinase [Treponema sp.]
MTIKSQLRILILIVVIIPLTAIITLPVYHYLTSPARYLMQGYEEVKELGSIRMSDNEWAEVREAIHNVPPGIEILIFYDDTIITSNFPQLKSGDHITKGELFDFIHTTSSEFDYQIHEGRAGSKKEEGLSRDKREWNERKNILTVCRSPITRENKRGSKFLLPSLIFLLVFETGVIIIIWKVSKSIASSITYVEERTRHIADGDLDTKIDENQINKKSSNEITSLIKSLEKMRSSLKADEERRIKFIMGVSHDLRTPVALIKGYTEAITDGVAGDMDSASVKKSLDIIHSKSEALEDMINDLINYVKLNSTDWVRSLEVREVKPVLDEIASSFRSTADLYKRQISTNIDIQPAVKIPLDKTLFERAVQNIFNNAVRYTKDGDQIKFQALQDNKCIKISIEDSGCGIAEKDLKNIFDLFYRASSSRREAGYGIGLSVVKTIVDSMNWSIDVKSQLNEGSCFTITIPLDQNRTDL